MEFTTHFELHSQTTRLVESASQKPWGFHAKDGILTLYDAPFQETCAWVQRGRRFSKLQLGWRKSHQILNLSFSLFTRSY